MTKPPRKRVLTPKVSKEQVKAAAARAEARSAGEEMEHIPAPITPPIVPAAALTAKAKAKGTKGRPTKYTPALGRAICKFMVYHGMGLREIGRRPRMPRESTILYWGMNPLHPFSEQFARAREIYYHRMFEDMIEISDDSRNDWMRRMIADGRSAPALNDEHIQRTKLRLETRWKILARALPKVYGEKVALDRSGKVEQVHSEAPQPTGEDHLADITKRYAIEANAHSVKGAGPAKANGKANGSGLH